MQGIKRILSCGVFIFLLLWAFNKKRGAEASFIQAAGIISNTGYALSGIPATAKSNIQLVAPPHEIDGEQPMRLYMGKQPVLPDAYRVRMVHWAGDTLSQFYPEAHIGEYRFICQ